MRPSLAIIAVCAGATAHAQVFVGEEYERRVQFDWDSDVMDGDDMQVVQSFEPGAFIETLDQTTFGLPGYFLQIDATQDSIIDDTVFWAAGESGFFHTTGTDLGGHMDLTASSSAFFFFELDVDAPDAPFRLTASLDRSAGWNLDLIVVNDDTGQVVFETHDGGNVDEEIQLEQGTFYVIEIASWGSFFLDDPNSVDDTFIECSSYEVHLELDACIADVNGDGNLDILDFVAFQALFIAQDPAADCDDNGILNVLDFVCFQQVFVEGC